MQPVVAEVGLVRVRGTVRVRVRVRVRGRGRGRGRVRPQQARRWLLTAARAASTSGGSTRNFRCHSATHSGSGGGGGADAAACAAAACAARSAPPPPLPGKACELCVGSGHAGGRTAPA